MLKHWQNSHGGLGVPEFKFKIVKFCRTALERQVGEATRITLRANTLNSKAGYNRSGVTRLTLKPEELRMPPRPRGDDLGIQEGMDSMTRKARERARTEEEQSRKRSADEDNQKRKRKRRRKLKYAVAESNWGLEMDEMGDMERRETARTRFLYCDQTMATVGSGGGQSKIRIWTTLELEARKIVLESMEDAWRLVAQREEEDVRAWMTSEAAKDEFDIVPEEWLKTGGLEISDDEEAVTDLKTLLISKEFTQRKKSLLKKQIKDLK